MSLNLLPRRSKCPPAPRLPVRQGLVCHCGALHHAVSADDRFAVVGELAAALARGKHDLAAQLHGRLDVCPNPGLAGVAR